MAKNQRINITFVPEPLEKTKADILAVAITEKSKKTPNYLEKLDIASGGIISQCLTQNDFKGKPNELMTLYPAKKSAIKRILLVGIGDAKKLTADTLRQAAGTAVRAAQSLNAERVTLALHQEVDKLDPETLGQALAEGILCGAYKYVDYLPEPKENPAPAILRIAISDSSAVAIRKLTQGAKVGQVIGNAQITARTLANRPASEIYPQSLAVEAQKLAHANGLKCKIFNDKQLQSMNMNAILAVGSGSVHKSRLIMLNYQGRGPKKTPDVVLVGKAITFDSGGLSLKTAEGMETMKFDKSGGCNVIGIMTAVAQLKLKLNVTGVIAAAENMPSHTSYHPGDIIKTYCGKTIEVLNTDAEGRIILSDALAYAADLKPQAIIDFATLTGACSVALGEQNAGLFDNNESLRNALLKASQTSAEAIWPLPSGPDYLDAMKSKVADLKNTGGRGGGACKAAAFLSEFVGDTPWAHLDIAATADTDKDKPWRSLGATGFGVRLTLEYLRMLVKQGK